MSAEPIEDSPNQRGEDDDKPPPIAYQDHQREPDEVNCSSVARLQEVPRGLKLPLDATWKFDR